MRRLIDLVGALSAQHLVSRGYFASVDHAYEEVGRMVALDAPLREKVRRLRGRSQDADTSA